MKHIVIAAALVAALVAALALAIPSFADELKVTAREAGIASIDGTGIAPAVAPGEGGGGVRTGVVPGANTGIVPPNFKPAPGAAAKYAIVATVTVEDVPVWRGKYRHEAFDDEATCKAFIAEDNGLKVSNAKLAEVAAAKINPDAKVGVSCEVDSD